MARGPALPQISLQAVRRLWLHRQGLAAPRSQRLTRARFVDHLRRTGGLQLDSVNVLDRAHYLTLWSRFGDYDRALVDRWTYRDRVAYEHWGHEACVLPAERLPRSRRGMQRFAPRGAWWADHRPSLASTRRVLRRLRDEGPLESADFAAAPTSSPGWWSWKEDKRALEILWHQGRVAVSSRKHFRRAYDIAERVYGEGPAAPLAAWQDGWLLDGLSGNGVATEKHLVNYCTHPRLKADDRRRVLARNLKAGRVVEVSVGERDGRWFALPEMLEGAQRLDAPTGTTLVCPFDSLLWQRGRAEDLLDFSYRIEIYVPQPKRVYGYYVLPILHDGRFVGRLDPKLHRERGLLEIKSLHLEPGFTRDADFDARLGETLHDLARFVGAGDVRLPRGWKGLLG